ncbi:MAG: endonuclease III [Phycisphaerales bacterium]|nr:MAG: endonuclease III [Phycisphaerales bacterium]
MAAKKESLAERKKRAGRIVAGLHKLYPDADCALEHKSALQLLVATILSAQSTDETVNKVTPILFARFPSAKALGGADREEVESIIYQTGFFRQKAKSIQNASAMIEERFSGQVPDTMDDLVQLPGVARKTANVILGTWFKKNEGVVVDTHVGRLAVRLGLAWTGRNEKDAVRIENDLMEILSRKEWTFAGHALIWHGRRVCSARKPDCQGCTLNKLCPSAFSFDGTVTGKRRPARTAAKKKPAAPPKSAAGRRAASKR